jgi:hypothetical protein
LDGIYSLYEDILFRNMKCPNDAVSPDGISFRWGSESIPEEVHERQQKELPLKMLLFLHIQGS